MKPFQSLRVALLALAVASASAAEHDAAAVPLGSPYAVEPEIEQSILESLHALVYDASVSQLIVDELHGGVQAAGPKEFELYVLAQSWQPEFCHGKEKVYPGCKSPLPYWRQHFTMHGLWPEYESGAPPGFCGGEPFDADRIENEIGFDALKEFWPDVKFSDASPEYPDFWKHEWTRHGTCSGLSQIEYFSHAVNLIRNGTAETPSLVQENVGKSVAIADLRKAFGGGSGSSTPAAVLKCMDGGDVLSQVFSCWSKDEKNVPVARRECPDHVLKEDTCSRSMIKIPAFSQ
ncbi:hypothetical protein Gpo141_00008779 [Globisporangium polare]